MNFVIYLHPTNAKQISHIKNRRLKKFIFAIFTFFCINSIHFHDTFMSNIPKPPNYFSAGNRKINIIHTKLRHNCILNNDLFRRNVIGSLLCSCGQVENSYHFFFSCPLYKQARNRLFNELLKIDQTNIIDTHLLLWGNEALPESLNKIIFAHVHYYIRDSSRFN